MNKQHTSVMDRGSSNGATTRRSTYEYDALGRRSADLVDRDGNGLVDQMDRWFHDGTERLFQARDGDGVGTAQPWRISNRYLHADGMDQLLADEQYATGTGPNFNSTPSTTAGTTLWTPSDHLGSGRDLVDNNGVIRKHVVYDSYGKRLAEVNRDAAGNVLPALSTAAVDSAFGYTGADWDADVNLTNHDARWYDAGSGRWLSQDPIGFEAGDSNLYRYVGNQPTTLTDPTGLEPPRVRNNEFEPPIFGAGGRFDPFNNISLIIHDLRDFIFSDIIGFEDLRGNPYVDVSGCKTGTIPFGPGFGGAAGNVRKGANSIYDDITATGSRYPNSATNVSKADFEKYLIASGWKRAVSKDGKATILEKDCAKYILRGGAKSTGGPTADYYKAGSQGISIKIRLGQGGSP
jgi:RHS repeat-associated protein